MIGFALAVLHFRPVQPETGLLVAGKYRLGRRLARGGMGAVWEARHVELDTLVALKFPHLETSAPSGLERFKREARWAAMLKSQYIVQIHDFGFDGETPYLAMELLVGEDLGLLLERETTVPTALAFDWIRQAGLGLREVHRAGLVHRDVKPSNLFLARDEHVKLLDFGIAQEPRADSGVTTEAGLVLGSAAFMSPEQARGRPLDARSDLWSLSAVLYRMLTGRLPFVGDNSADIVVRVCTEEVPAPSTLRAELDERHDALFRRALAKSADARFQDMDEFLEALDRLELRDSSPSLVPRSSPSTPTSSTRGRDEETAPLRATEIAPLHSEVTPLPHSPPLSATEASSSKRRRVGGAAAWLIAGFFVAAFVAVLVGRQSSDAKDESTPATPTRDEVQSHPSARDETRLNSAVGAAKAESASAEAMASSAVGSPVTAPEAAPTAPRLQVTGGGAKKTSTPSRASPSRPKSSATAAGSSAPATDPVFGLPVTDP